MNDDRIKLFSQPREVGYDSISYYKGLILDDLKKDTDLLELLDNPNLSPARPEDYIDVNIYSSLRVPDSQSTVKNYLCFELDESDVMSYNEYKAIYVLTFRCICHEKDILTPWGINRHDLMGAIIKDRYLYSNIIGNVLNKTYDQGYLAEGNYYYYRTIKFQTIQNLELRQVQKKNYLDLNRDLYDRHTEFITTA